MGTLVSVSRNMYSRENHEAFLEIKSKIDSYF